jgi:hypothetical protein
MKTGWKELLTIDSSDVATNYPLLLSNGFVIGKRRQNKFSTNVLAELDVLGLLKLHWDFTVFVRVEFRHSKLLESPIFEVVVCTFFPIRAGIGEGVPNEGRTLHSEITIHFRGILLSQYSDLLKCVDLPSI